MRTDVPSYAVSLTESSYAQDIVTPYGISRQRWGWKYGEAHVATTTNAAVARTYFPVLTNPTSLFVVSDSVTGRLYARGISGSTNGTLIWDNVRGASTYWLPRCVYNGELILCAQDGVQPLIRWSGNATTSSQGNRTMRMNSKSMDYTILTGGDFNASKGMYIAVEAFGNQATAWYGGTDGRIASPTMCVRNLGNDAVSASQPTESLRNKTDRDADYGVIGGAVLVHYGAIGFGYPCVSIVESGKAATWNYASYPMTLAGTKLTSEGLITDFPLRDAVVVLATTDGAPIMASDIGAVTSDTGIDAISPAPDTRTNAGFRILRRMPFKDATVHRGSFWGTGVKQYPNRVYVYPPSKDIGLPPGAEKPFDPTVAVGYSSSKVWGFTRLADMLAGAYDIPSPYDKTPVVALLSSPGPLLVLKSDTVYGMYGTYDSTNPTSIEVTRIAGGSGCIDRRSAITIDSTPFWAGTDGVFTYRNGSVVNLTAGKIRTEWASLMRGYVDGTSWVAIAGVEGSYLVISCGGLTSSRTGGAKNGPDTQNPTARTYLYDLRNDIWLGRLSNFSPRQMWVTTADENGSSIPWDSIYAAVDGKSNVVDFGPALTGVDPTNVRDADATYPRMQGWTTFSLAQADGVEGEARFLDAIFHTNLYDSSGTSSQISLSVLSGGSINEAATQTKTLDPISADTVDRIDRFKRRVNRTGRLHQIRLDMATTSLSNLNSEIPEIVMSFRDTRRTT